MPKYTPWTWSAPHGRHYSYLVADDGTTILDTIWAGHPAASSASTAETTSDSTPRTTSAYSNPSASSSHGSSLGGNYTYSTTKTEEEDDDEGEEEDDDDDAGEAVTQTGKQRADSGLATYPQYQTTSTASYTSAASQVAGKGRQPSVSQGSQYQGYQYGTQYNTSSMYQQPQTQYQSPRNTIAILPADVQATLGYKDRRFIQTGTDRNETEQLDIRKDLNTKRNSFTDHRRLPSCCEATSRLLFHSWSCTFTPSTLYS